MRAIAFPWPALAVVVFAVALATGSCKGSPETSPADTAAAQAAAATASPEPVSPALPGPSEIEVCAELPAETLGAALGLPVAAAAQAAADDPAPNCTYRFEAADGASRVDVYLRDGTDFDWALETAKNFDREVIDVAGLGERAYRKATLDGWWEVWVRRPDGSVVQTTAREVELAEGAAATALREIF